MKACKARKKKMPEGMQIRKARRHVGYGDT